MIRQLRIYTIAQGRRETFFDRWDSTARPLMEGHGFRFLDAWTGRVDPTSRTIPVRMAKALMVLQRQRSGSADRELFEFGYELEWLDLQELRGCWAAFLADPRWVAAKARSRRSPVGEPVLMVSDRVLTPRPRAAT